MNVSINGRLIPQSSDGNPQGYRGHFLQVSYTQAISQQGVFSKDRVEVESDGRFRFFLPDADALYDASITVEVRAPSGEALGRQVYSYGSLKASAIDPNVPDTTSALELEVDAKIITFNEDAPAAVQPRKISGKVVDVSGKKRVAGVHLVVMGRIQGASTFQPIFATRTDADGYFFVTVEPKVYEEAYGVLAGTEDPVPLHLDKDALPKTIILALDLSASDLEDAQAELTVPNLPDQNDLTASGAFSQDLGGKCIDFTVPNRTLEAFSFFHTVRTTEPEIKGLSLTPKESQRIKSDLVGTSDAVFAILSKMNHSFQSLHLLSLDMKASDASSVPLKTRASSEGSHEAAHPQAMFEGWEVAVTDLEYFTGVHNDVEAIRRFAEHRGKAEKLRQLHYKLTAAYCGLHGVEETMHYCHSLEAFELLDLDKIQSLAGHVKDYTGFVEAHPSVLKMMVSLLRDIELLAHSASLQTDAVDALEDKTKGVIKGVDRSTKASREQEQLLGYLRRIIKELSRAKAHPLYRFQMCPPDETTQNMGIICVLQEYRKIKEKLEHKGVLSLGEITEIRSYYNLFLSSISAFLDLLDEFHRFYRSLLLAAVSLHDAYFVEHYDEIKTRLSRLKQGLYGSIRQIEALEREYIYHHPGRKNLTVETEIDWDESPTVYHNTTIAHGHILHFKQQWKADGYSLGDLLYSLPLAPCQEKQIAILDWDRDERAGRTEAQTVEEHLAATISHDRDVSEVARSAFSEHIDARSTNKTKSTSAGIGGALGGFISPVAFGVAGGVSHSGASSTSTANQNASRNLSASSLNQLQDRVSQAASSLRAQRSSVVQTVAQGESLKVQTEVIKNHNHCHSMTVEYFEVLRHFVIEQDLVDVQECLFVPLPMSRFDFDKILRWKHTLRSVIYGSKLLRGFDAIERIESEYRHSHVPDGIYADTSMEDLSGHFYISFDFERPPMPEVDDAQKEETYVEVLTRTYFWITRITAVRIAKRLVPLSDEEKDRLFQKEYAHELAREFVDHMRIVAVTDRGEEDLNVDLSLISRYSRGARLRVNLSRTVTTPLLRRSAVKGVIFRSTTDVNSMSRIILHTAWLQYRSAYASDYILRGARIDNDIINQDAALVYTPLSTGELRHPKKEDLEIAYDLMDFLNEHLELAHKVIWSQMDSSRLFGLLDGYIAPNSGGKSVASVVENRVMGVVGNNLVLKVVPGERLDPVFRGVEDLLSYYQPTTPVDPFRISMPTKGVYAESVMGQCNSCEKIDETRHWRFADEPCGTQPTAIATVSTDSRRSDTGDLQAKDLPTSIINLQNAPAAPDPTGLAPLYGLMGKGDSFQDYTGLAGTQANALKALETTSKSVTDLASLSKDMANLGVMANSKVDGSKQIEQIKKLKKDGYLSDGEAKQEIQKVLDTYNNAAKSVSRPEATAGDSVAKTLTQHTVDSSNPDSAMDIKYAKMTPDGSSESIQISKNVSGLEAGLGDTDAEDVFDDEDFDDGEIGDHDALFAMNSDMRDQGGQG